MERKQIENIYKFNGLRDFKLKDTDDLMRIHGVDYKNVDGYNKLDDLNRTFYKKFIVKFFNGHWLETRSSIIPKSINFVEDILHLGKENIKDDEFVPLGGTINIVCRNGLKMVMRTWNDDEYKNLNVLENEVDNYLRFEYTINGKNEWLHVIKNGEEWY